jgi:hypothetical protein
MPLCPYWRDEAWQLTAWFLPSLYRNLSQSVTMIRQRPPDAGSTLKARPAIAGHRGCSRHLKPMMASTVLTMQRQHPKTNPMPM